MFSNPLEKFPYFLAGVYFMPPSFLAEPGQSFRLSGPCMPSGFKSVELHLIFIFRRTVILYENTGLDSRLVYLLRLGGF